MRLNTHQILSRAALTLALALTACGQGTESQQPLETHANPANLATKSNGLTIVSGYNLAIVAGTYTVAGLVLPRWSAPAGHSAQDYLTVAQVGSDPSSYIDWQYVNNSGVTSGIAQLLSIPVGTDTTVQYEVRYFLADRTLAAVSSAFSVKPTPIIDCGTSISGGTLPTAHSVNLYMTSGTLVVNWDMNSVPDGIRVYQNWPANRLFASGPVAYGGSSGPLAFSSNTSRVLVQMSPDPSNQDTSGWTWNIPCP